MCKDPNVVPNNIVNPTDHCNVCVEPQPLLRRISTHYRDRPVEPVLPVIPRCTGLSSLPYIFYVLSVFVILVYMGSTRHPHPAQHTLYTTITYSLVVKLNNKTGVYHSYLNRPKFI